MIRSCKGNITIDGTIFELTFEYQSIITKLLESTPEIVLSTLYGRREEFEKAIINADAEKLDACEYLINNYVKCRKELDNE